MQKTRVLFPLIILIFDIVHKLLAKTGPSLTHEQMQP